LNWLEYGQTLVYLHRSDEALEAYSRAKALGIIGLFDQTYLILTELKMGDVPAALTRAQQLARSTDLSTRVAAWEPFLLARDLNAAQAFADAWPAEFEIRREVFLPAESFQAVVLRLRGDHAAARDRALEAVAKLNAPGGPFPDDYRKHHALALAYAAAGDRVKALELTDRAIGSRPRDAVEQALRNYELARSLALVGENFRALELLEPLLKGVGGVSVVYVELDPHWDDMRDDQDFITLLDRYRGREGSP
jgi:tetratricopeptide (TPR) repeat protein